MLLAGSFQYLAAMPGIDGHNFSSDPRIDGLLRLLAASANRDYIGEGVSQLEHALQAAALARAARAADAEVIAALLHDIGHLCAPRDAPTMDDFGVARHEEVGAEYLRSIGFGPEVTELVSGHVAAKRYLVSADPAHAVRLSAASRATLRHQGGPMTEDELRRFEALPRHRAMLRVRSWDESAKQPGLAVDGLDSYVTLLLGQLRGS